MLAFNLDEAAGSQDKKKRFDLAIIGAGPAGLTAGMYAGRAQLDTVIFDRGTIGGQLTLTDKVENYPGFPEGITAAELIHRFRQHAERFGARVLLEEIRRIEPLDDGTFHLWGMDAQPYHAKAVILAMGSRPRTLDVPGEKEFAGRGVSYCAVCDGPFFKDQPVAVVGGGDSAFEEGLYLAKIVSKVILIHRRDEFRAAPIFVEQARSNPKFEFVLNSVVEEIYGDNKVRGVRVRNRKTGEVKEIPVEAVFIFIGHIPNTDLVRELVDLDAQGHVITDEHMRTSVPGIFAAGDLRNTPIRQVTTAAGDATIAVYTAQEYIREVERRIRASSPH